MKYKIERHNNKFYVFYVDSYGNRYDSMHHFDSMLLAKQFIKTKAGR